ncbi:type II toxin-antitoxin system RelE/ParE family toxin [Streptococcus hyointestinalis]|uniref:type II toxin-antitoxin system RelE/ParE family toxin n=1 Tax=Streptococcus hyointestinalis TaxID=1337 RepID=UPI0013E0A905|nr:type II toxin-antitoxin system RelE/ParE family toxin [Streptococcus hyointestinalis]
MKNPKFEFYTRPNGRTEFQEFLDELPKKDKEKLLTVIASIQEHGLLVSQRMEWVKKLDEEIFEIRSKVSSNIQRALYFHVVDNRYVITHGFTKKTQKTPKAQIEHAKQLKVEFEKEENKNDNYKI